MTFPSRFYGIWTSLTNRRSISQVEAFRRRASIFVCFAVPGIAAGIRDSLPASIGDSRIALHRAGALPAPNRMHNCASVPEVPAARGPDGLIREKNLERRDKHTAIIIDI